ncbi:hypothetical protein QJS66_18850 [Kocuria rhizophila]|nr:hypothetical protein QJS66_18850 [Kocuria rhizophila]
MFLFPPPAPRGVQRRSERRAAPLRRVRGCRAALRSRRLRVRRWGRGCAMSSEQPDTQPPSHPRRGSHGHGLTSSSIRPVRAVIGLLAVTAQRIYAIPLDPDRDLVGTHHRLNGLLAVVGVVIIRHLRLRGRSRGWLFLLLMVAVAAIALSFHAVSMIPGQFEGLETRTCTRCTSRWSPWPRSATGGHPPRGRWPARWWSWPTGFHGLPDVSSPPSPGGSGASAGVGPQPR